MDIYTKNGRPLQVLDDKVYSRSGVIIGRINGSMVYGTDGRYVGSILGDRLVYRSTDSAGIGGSFAASSLAATGRASNAASGVSGEEPDVPD